MGCETNDEETCPPSKIREICGEDVDAEAVRHTERRRGLVRRQRQAIARLAVIRFGKGIGGDSGLCGRQKHDDRQQIRHKDPFPTDVFAPLGMAATPV